MASPDGSPWVIDIAGAAVVNDFFEKMRHPCLKMERTMDTRYFKRPPKAKIPPAGIGKAGSGGFTMIEVVIALLLLGIAVVPMIDAFTPALHSTVELEKCVVVTNRARGTLTRVMALDFQTLTDNLGDPVDLAALFGSVAEADKETFSVGGQQYTPAVGIVDVSGGDGRLLELLVSMDGSVFKTMKADY